MSFPRFPVLVLVAVLVSACGNDKPATPAVGNGATGTGASATDAGAPPFDITRIANGAKLYQENCAQCHGPEAQGHPDWQRGRKDGFAAAPPLNGTGTEVSLSRSKMMEIIRNGVTRDGVPMMPAWHGRVADRDVEDIIAWFQALWPSDVYHKWRRANADEAAKPGTKG